MNEIELYAVIGRKQLELDEVHSNYNILLSLLSMIVRGEIDPGHVKVDLQGRSWVLDRPAPVDSAPTPEPTVQ